mmetsp:Transcript_162134/g.287296  ORF Transcript_162134/g.287296 Transcript_162134/m.287296 type:complete len:214 (-) Transcript_162134:35-676(-)
MRRMSKSRQMVRVSRTRESCGQQLALRSFKKSFAILGCIAETSTSGGSAFEPCSSRTTQTSSPTTCEPLHSLSSCWCSGSGKPWRLHNVRLRSATRWMQFGGPTSARIKRSSRRSGARGMSSKDWRSFDSPCGRPVAGWKKPAKECWVQRRNRHRERKRQRQEVARRRHQHQEQISRQQEIHPHLLESKQEQDKEVAPHRRHCGRARASNGSL